jgi:hypothetical protein
MHKLLIAVLATLALALAVTANAKNNVEDFYLKVGDRLPYYTIQVVTSAGAAVDISSDTITATVENTDTGQEICTATAVNITNGPLGYAELRWPDASTNTAGTYAIEFKGISGGLQYTLPASFDAFVIIRSRY